MQGTVSEGAREISTSQKVCAIVDPYSSSNLYAPVLKAKGYKCVAVQSEAQPTSIIAGSLRTSDFEDVVKFTGHLDQMVNELKQREVSLLVPGMEMGLELADALGERLKSHIYNDPKTSHLRRHKFDMVEAVKESGLAAARQLKSADIGEILVWAKETSAWPLVVKPADSGGADRVHLCNDERELKDAVQSSIGSIGRQGRPIREVVVQEFIPGIEYIVDTVSYQGHHMIVNIWKYNRVAVNGAQFVYDTKELVPFEGEIQEQLIAYTKNALDAVGFKSGPSHNEVMMTDKGPMLIEVNARMGGSAAPVLNRECVGRGQLDIMMDVLLDPNKFLNYYDEPYRIKKHGLAVYFISRDYKHTVNAEAAEKISALASCYSLRLASPGTILAKTVDMFTMPGMIELVSENKNQLWKDYEFIRAQEQSGHLYVLAEKV